MKTVIGVALLAGGIVMLVFGFQARGSFNDQIKETFEGTPRTRTTWMIAGGAAASVAGVALILLQGGKGK
jgi:TRAP-type C4-dicarboxylate transport system permease small subunit